MRLFCLTPGTRPGYSSLLEKAETQIRHTSFPEGRGSTRRMQPATVSLTFVLHWLTQRVQNARSEFITEARRNTSQLLPLVPRKSRGQTAWTRKLSRLKVTTAQPP